MINFKANYIGQTNVTDTFRNKNQAGCKVSFVEMNPQSKQDVTTMREVTLNWGRDSYATNIMEHFQYSYFCGDDLEENRFFALTTQRSNFEKLETDEVLALALVSKESDKRIDLKYLQVDPENNYFSAKRRYEGIGRGILRSICKLFGNKDIFLQSANTACGFYKSQGFEQIKNTTFFVLKR